VDDLPTVSGVHSPKFTPHLPEASMSDFVLSKHADEFVAAHRTAARSSRSIPFPGGKDRNMRVIARGPLRGKRVSTYQTIPVGPISPSRSRDITRGIKRNRADLQSKWQEPWSARLRAVRKRFYQLPG
jgi:hypothetical protein